MESGNLGQNLRNLRKARGVTQGKISAVLGLDQTTVSNIETGKSCISVEKLVLFAEFFDVSLDYLAGRTEKSEVNK